MLTILLPKAKKPVFEDPNFDLQKDFYFLSLEYPHNKQISENGYLLVINKLNKLQLNSNLIPIIKILD